MPFITVKGGNLEYRMVLGDAVTQPTLVFLHEGLGCVELWRDFPDRVAHALGARALIYSRFGYGRSDGLAASRTPRFMHEEALDVLPSCSTPSPSIGLCSSVIRTAPRSR